MIFRLAYVREIMSLKKVDSVYRYPSTWETEIDRSPYSQPGLYSGGGGRAVEWGVRIAAIVVKNKMYTIQL